MPPSPHPARDGCPGHFPERSSGVFARRAPPSASDGPSGQAVNLSRRTVPIPSCPPCRSPQAPPVMPTPSDAERLMRARPSWPMTAGVVDSQVLTERDLYLIV